MTTQQTREQIEAQRAQLEQELAKLKAENAKLLSVERAQFSLRVSEKGGISVYGMGRFPVTLYREQMEKFLAHSDEIKAFIAANAGSLKTRPVKA